jgi:predicted dehydrogenase
MKPTHLALCGLGLIGKAHLRVIQNNPHSSLTSIVDPSDGAKQMAFELGVAHFDRLDLAISAGNLDGVILATPNSLHVTQAIECIKSKLPVLVEKPIADQVSQARELVQLSHASGVPVLVGHHRAHSSIMREAVSQVQSGALGRLVCFQGSATFYKNKEYFEQGPWRKQAGGGPLLINMIHEVHNMQMLCGRITSVQTTSSNFIRAHEVEDTVCMALSFESGALGTFMLSDCAASPLSWEHTSAENKAYPHSPLSNCYHLSGTQGTLSIPTMTVHKYPVGTPASWFTPMQVESLAFDQLDPLEVQLAHFLEVIKHQTPPLVSAQNGLDNLIAVNAIIESAKTGQRVRIE